MTISNWPATERPREKLLRHGARVLSDAELVALFLRTGRPGCHAVDLARELLSRHGGLRAFLRCERATLCAHHGFGEAAYALLQGALELSRRSLWEQLANGVALGSPADTRTYLRAQLRDLQHEVFACVFLDNRHRVVRFEELFRGSIDGASVYPREVVKRALALNAAAVIFAHNHPSGVAEPSSADTRITTRLRDALALVDIRVLDHIIVGDDEPVSLAERGVL